MAEFAEVMRQWRRFCKSHNNCGECEFDGKGICCEAHLSGVPYSDMELRIMAWAAEHPEPVYPTWGQFFRRNYGLEYCKEHEMLLEHIPADIAEKLGLQPKEGV